jgi:hypothetical protein
VTRRSRLLIALALLASPVTLAAQDATRPGYEALGPGVTAPGLDTPVSISLSGSLREIVGRIAAQANLSVAFDDSLPGLSYRTTLRTERMPAGVALQQVLDGTPLQALVSQTGQVVLVRRPQRPPRGASVGGTIHDSLTGMPVAGARVELIGTRFAALTNDSGRFSMGRVPNGDYAVRVTRLGFEPLNAVRVHVADDAQQASLAFVMHRATPSLAEIVVTPGYFGILQSSLATPQALSREQIETVPQIGEDIYRAVARLPGVSADDFSAKFSVRGGSGDELYVSLDGLELIEPFHLKDFGGAFSIIDIQALGSASLTTGGFSAEYGDRLTGVFTMQSADPRTDRTRTSLGVSLMNARATMQGGFADGKGGWLVSARPGYLDLALKLTSIRDSLKPRYYDVFAKAQYDLANGGRIGIHALHAGDDFSYLSSNEPGISSNYGSSYLWLTWDDKFGSRLRMQSVASAGDIRWRRFGEQSDTSGVQRVYVNDDRSLGTYGLRQDWSLDAASRLLVKWGFDAKHESASYDYLRTMDVRNNDGTDAGRYDTTSVIVDPRSNKLALYLSPRVQLLPSLTMELGVRYDRASHDSSSIVSPRLNLSWEATPGTTLRAAWGKYTQSQALFSLQAQDGVSTFSPAERAEQRILGVEQALPDGIVGRVEAYQRRLTAANGFYENTSGDVRLFPEINWDRVYLARDSGLDRGIELQASRGDGRRIDWSASYALAKSVDYVNGREVPRNFDQRHSVHFDWSLHPSSNAWRLAVGGIWHSGWPYTPTNMIIDTLVNTPTQFSIHVARQAGEINSERLRAYQRLDMRWTRYFDTARGRVSVFGEVYNLLDTANPRGVEKDLIVAGRRLTVLTQDITMWPRLPIVGFTWEF